MEAIQTLTNSGRAAGGGVASVASPVAPPPLLYCYPLLRRGASTDTVLRVRAVLGIIAAGGIRGADRVAAHRAGLAPAPFPHSAAVRVFIAEEEEIAGACG